MSIPKGWKSQKLEEVSIGIIDCHHSTPVWTDSGFIVLRTHNIKDGSINFSSVSFTDEISYKERIKRAIPEKDDIVLTREAPAGEVALIPDNLKVCLGQRLVLIKLNNNFVSSSFVKFYLMSNLVQRNVFQLQANGSTVGNIRIPVLKGINLFLPPLREQCRIAEILGVWDESIDLLEKLIAAKRKLKQGLMQQLFTGKKRCKEFGNSKWEKISIGDIAYVDKKSLSNNTPGEHSFLYISLSDIDNGVISTNLQELCFSEAPSRARRLVTDNDILMATVRPNLKSFAMVKNDADKYVVSTGFAVITTKKGYSHNYLYQYIFSDYIEKQINALVTGSNYPAINSTEIKGLVVNCPSLEEQEKIADVLSAADDEISILEKQLAAYKEQKRGLMQQLLTGRTRILGLEDG